MRWTGTRVCPLLRRLAGRRQGAAARVLVAADDEVIAQLIAVHLKIAGCAVEVARDGRSALERARATGPDVVILDANMPRMAGWDVAARLRRDPATASIAAIVLAPRAAGGQPAGVHAAGRQTAGDQPAGDRPAGDQRDGVDACLAKPFDPGELVAAVQRLARVRSTRSRRPRGSAGR